MESAFGLKLDIRNEEDRKTIHDLSSMTRMMLTDRHTRSYRRFVRAFFNLFLDKY